MIEASTDDAGAIRAGEGDLDRPDHLTGLDPAADPQRLFVRQAQPPRSRRTEGRHALRGGKHLDGHRTPRSEARRPGGLGAQGDRPLLFLEHHDLALLGGVLLGQGLGMLIVLGDV